MVEQALLQVLLESLGGHSGIDRFVRLEEIILLRLLLVIHSNRVFDVVAAGGMLVVLSDTTVRVG